MTKAGRRIEIPTGRVTASLSDGERVAYRVRPEQAPVVAEWMKQARIFLNVTLETRSISTVEV